MNIRKILSNHPLLASFIVSIYRKRKTVILKDNDGDFEIRLKGESFFSSSPFAWFDNATKELFSFGYKCSAGDNAVIVGVEDGLELTYFCRLCHPGKVIAVEPTRECIRRLRKLKAKNSLENLLILEAAASSSASESVPFFSSLNGDRNISNTILSFEESDTQPVQYIPTIRLDDIFESLNIERVDFLKINVEGAELLVLEGIELYEGKIRNVCISCHDFICPGLRTYDAVRNWLTSHGYSFKCRETCLSRPWENYYVFASK